MAQEEGPHSFSRPWYLRTITAYKLAKGIYKFNTSWPVVSTFAWVGEGVAETVLSRAPFVGSVLADGEAPEGARLPTFSKLDSKISSLLNTFDEEVDHRYTDPSTPEYNVVHVVAVKGAEVASFVPVVGPIIRRICRDIDPELVARGLTQGPLLPGSAAGGEERGKEGLIDTAQGKGAQTAPQSGAAAGQGSPGQTAAGGASDASAGAVPPLVRALPEPVPVPVVTEKEEENEAAPTTPAGAGAKKSNTQRAEANAQEGEEEPPSSGKKGKKRSNKGRELIKQLSSWSKTKKSSKNYPRTPTNELPAACGPIVAGELEDEEDGSEESVEGKPRPASEPAPALVEAGKAPDTPSKKSFFKMPQALTPRRSSSGSFFSTSNRPSSSTSN